MRKHKERRAFHCHSKHDSRSVFLTDLFIYLFCSRSNPSSTNHCFKWTCIPLSLKPDTSSKNIYVSSLSPSQSVFPWNSHLLLCHTRTHARTHTHSKKDSSLPKGTITFNHEMGQQACTIRRNKALMHLCVCVCLFPCLCPCACVHCLCL